MIPKFKKYLKESVWGDIRQKSLGQSMRKETNIDSFNADDFYKYLKSLYLFNKPNNRLVLIVTTHTISIPFMCHKKYFNLEVEYDFMHKKIEYITVSDICVEWYENMENDFYVTGYPDDETRVSICPKDRKRPLSNTFVIEVIDYLLANSSNPEDNLCEKVVNESVWSDLRKKSLGQELRDENVVKFDNLNEGTMEDLYNYIIQNYEYTKEPANEYRSIRQFGKDISVPITLDGGMMGTTTDFLNHDEMEFIVIRNDLVKYLDDEAYSRYFDYVEKDNPDDENTKIIVDGDYFPKKNMIGIIDALIENVPNPALRKKAIRESVWGDLRKKSLGQEDRTEDNINLLDQNDFYNYLTKRYKRKHWDMGVDKFPDLISVIVFENTKESRVYRAIIHYEDGDPYLEIPRAHAFLTSDILQKVKDNYKLTETGDSYNAKYRVEPMDDRPVDNKFFIEVIDFLLDNATPPYQPIIIRDESVQESVWNDVRKKSLGKEERMENNIDGLGFHEFVSYLKDTYIIDDPTNFFAIGIFPTMGTDIINISIPIEKKDIYGEDKNGNRMLTIGKNQKTDKFVNIRPNKYLFELYPSEMARTFKDEFDFDIDYENFQLIPKNGEITNSLCVKVIDSLLSIVERPILIKNK